MVEIAKKMLNMTLYDHPSWDCLKSITELEFEARQQLGPNAGKTLSEMLSTSLYILSPA